MSVADLPLWGGVNGPGAALLEWDGGGNEVASFSQR